MLSNDKIACWNRMDFFTAICARKSGFASLKFINKKNILKKLINVNIYNF